MTINDLKSGDIYRHFKGNIYRIVAVARDADTLKEVVVYQNESKGDVWVRDAENFCENVTRDGKTFARFNKMNSGE